MDDKEIRRLHKGKFTASKLGCPRSQALHVLGYEAKFGKKILVKFEEGKEHDEVMKEEAEEEFEDYFVPEPLVLTLKEGDTTARLALSPDGERDNEIVEFKGLAASFWNSLNSEEDIRNGSDLTQKYYKQVQAYAGAFKKGIIRFRMKNKKNLKVKDIVFKANPKIWEGIKNELIDIQILLDKGELPPVSCSKKAEKNCPYRMVCREKTALEIAGIEEKKLSANTQSKLTRFVELYLEAKIKRDVLEIDSEKLKNGIAAIMKSHGQREQKLIPGNVKFGVRYREKKNQEDIDFYVDEGSIRIDQQPEPYCDVRASKKKGGKKEP